VKIHQVDYIEKLIKKFKMMDAASVLLNLTIKHYMFSNICLNYWKKKWKAKKSYIKLLGSLHFANLTRPDIGFKASRITALGRNKKCHSLPKKNLQSRTHLRKIWQTEVFSFSLHIFECRLGRQSGWSSTVVTLW